MGVYFFIAMIALYFFLEVHLDVFMTCVIISILTLLFIAFSKESTRNKKEKEKGLVEELKSQIINYDSCHIFSSKKHSVEVERYIIDKENLLLFSYNLLTKTLIKNNIQQISKCELLLNENLVQTTDSGSLVGRALVGGVLMGGVGAVVGGASASKTSAKDDKIESGEIILYFGDVENPLQKLKFTNNTDIRDEIMHFHATLCACIAKAHENDTATIRQCPFCAEDIKIAAKVCKHCGKDVSLENIEK